MIFDSSTVCGRVFFGSKDKQIVENDNAKPWKLTLVILTASSLLMSASYTMLVPFLPMYLIQELNVAQDEVNIWSGIIFAISFAISGIMAPIWGAMADKKSRKLMAVRAAICLSITYVRAVSCRTSGSSSACAYCRALRRGSGRRALRS